jgi:glutathione S-transferase
MSKKNELYVAGNNLTYADFLFYYELTNLRYFQMEIQQSWIKEWSSRVHQLQ